MLMLVKNYNVQSSEYNFRIRSKLGIDWFYNGKVAHAGLEMLKLSLYWWVLEFGWGL